MKSMKRSKIVGALLLVLGMVLVLSGCGRHKPDAEQVNAEIAERLDLSEEQATRVQPVTADLYGERGTLLKLRREVYDEVLAQLKSETANTQVLESVLKASWSEVGAHIPKVTNAFVKYHAVMDSEKRAKFAEKMEKRRKKMKEGRHRFWSFSDEGPTAEDINGKMADHLDLTPEQEKRMLPVTEKLFSERDAIKHARLKIYDEVLAQLKNDTTDTTQLESVLHTTWTTVNQRIPMAAKAIASVHAILTAEQRAELSEKLERRQQRRKNRRQHRWHDWH